MRLACVTITPLGFPVEPDVYCRNASELGSGSSPSKFDAAEVSTVSVHSQLGLEGNGEARSAEAATLRVAALERMSRAPESEMMPAKRGSSLALRRGTTGTATRRAKKQAKIASMNSKLGW